MLKNGYVKIISGANKNRIARYLGDDENGKALISYTYDQDIITNGIYNTINKKVLSNDISLIDLIDRYYDLSDELNKIAFRGHLKIKKHSAKHYDLILESNLIRDLLHQYLSIDNLTFKNKEKNIYIYSSFKDCLNVNDLIGELLLKYWYVSLNDHERNNQNNDKMLELCSNFIFVLSKNYQVKDFKDEYRELVKILGNTHAIKVVTFDKTLLEDNITLFSSNNSQELTLEVEDFEKQLINHEIN